MVLFYRIKNTRDPLCNTTTTLEKQYPAIHSTYILPIQSEYSDHIYLFQSL